VEAETAIGTSSPKAMKIDKIRDNRNERTLFCVYCMNLESLTIKRCCPQPSAHGLTRF
jgi:hypothetical protein